MLWFRIRWGRTWLWHRGEDGAAAHDRCHAGWIQLTKRLHIGRDGPDGLWSDRAVKPTGRAAYLLALQAADRRRRARTHGR